MFTDETQRLHFIDEKTEAGEGQMSYRSAHCYLVECSGVEPRTCPLTHYETSLSLTTVAAPQELICALGLEYHK